MVSTAHSQGVQREIQLSNGSVMITEQGSGPVMLLLHSNPGNALDYSAVMPELSKHYRVIAVDWPGYGVSPPVTAPDKMSAFVLLDVLSELIEQLNIPSCIIIGHSVGGSVAVHYALHYPQKVRALVLVSSGGFTPHNWLTRGFTRLQGSKSSLAPVIFAQLYVRKRNPISNAIITRAKTLHSTDQVKQVGRDVWNSFLDPDYDLAQKARAITQPVLLVLGSKDPVISSNGDGKVMREAMPDATWALLDSGHVPFAESPAAFMEVLNSFLGNLP